MKSTVDHVTDPGQLAAELLREKKLIQRLIASERRRRENESPKELVRRCVGANTFRRFPGRPSTVFRPWALSAFEGGLPNKLGEIQTQREFDAWAENLSKRLRDYWKEKRGEPLGYGPSRKMVNLLLKAVALGKAVKPRSARFLHVPLDSEVLEALRRCSPKTIQVLLPPHPSMGHVTDKRLYDRLQQQIREIVSPADVPPIYLDWLIWDVRRWIKELISALTRLEEFGAISSGERGRILDRIRA